MSVHFLSAHSFLSFHPIHQAYKKICNYSRFLVPHSYAKTLFASYTVGDVCDCIYVLEAFDWSRFGWRPPWDLNSIHSIDAGKKRLVGVRGLCLFIPSI